MSSSSSSSITASSTAKEMISSPLASSTITPYTKEQLSEILLGQQTATSTTFEDGYVDVGLLAEIVSEHIISGYPSVSETPPHYPLSSFIYSILFASSLHITILTTALAHIDEFHTMMSDFEPRGVYDFDEACRFFLAAYMAAARAAHGELSYLTFWAKVVGDSYTALELCLIETSFVGTMRGEVATIESSSDDDDDQTEGTLMQSESDTDNDTDNELSSHVKGTISPPVVIATFDPVAEQAKALAKAQADLVTVVLRIAANRLKEQARAKSPTYAPCLASALLLDGDKEKAEIVHVECV